MYGIFPASLRTFQQENLECRNFTDFLLRLTFMYAVQYVKCCRTKMNVNLMLKIKWKRKSMSDFPFPIYYPLFLSNNSCSWRTTIINYISSYSMSNLVQKHQRVIDLCSLQRDVPQCLCNSSHFPKGSTLRSHFFDLHCSNDSHTKDILQCFHRKIMKFVPMCS